MSLNRIQAAEVKLWDFSAYFWNAPRSLCLEQCFSCRIWLAQADAIILQLVIAVSWLRKVVFANDVLN